MTAENTDYGKEPCPACNGTGFRAVAPPPEPRGGGERKGQGRRHGYESTYQIGCRCELCRAAHRAFQRTRAAAARLAKG